MDKKYQQLKFIVVLFYCYNPSLSRKWSLEGSSITVYDGELHLMQPTPNTEKDLEDTRDNLFKFPTAWWLYVLDNKNNTEIFCV